MPFKRFVETGRVACISGGRYCGKLCSIVDVIDQTRVLVDGPKTGVPRIPIRLNQIRLTKYRIKFPFKARTKIVRLAWENSEVLNNWKKGQWASNLAKRNLRRRLSDFDRFKLRHARKARNALRTEEYCRLLKACKKRKEKLKKAQAKWRIAEKLKKTGKPPKPKKPKSVKKATTTKTTKPAKSAKTAKTAKTAKPAKPVKPDGTKAKPAKPDGTKAKPAKPEGSKAKPAKPEGSKTKAAKPDAGKAKPQTAKPKSEKSGKK